jgi:uncharacterized delta-60 repeat protein
MNPTTKIMHSWAPALFILLGRLTGMSADGDLDGGFAPNLNAFVYSTGLQADGKILIGGAFTTIDGTPYNHIARLNADGTADSSFNPDVNGTVYCIAVQADGKILVGGIFSTVNGTPYNRLARLNADGTLDSTFNDPTVNSTVNCIAVQADGKILLGGWFSSVGAATYNLVARLNADGTVDSTFTNPSVSGSYATSIALQADGKILIGGGFSSVGGLTCKDIARLNANGTVDSTLNSPIANGQVYSVMIQADGKILLGGSFPSVGGATNYIMARLNANGMVDSSFNNPIGDSSKSVESMVVQTDGKILIVGGFATLGGVGYIRVARLNSDGTVDSNFNASADGNVNSVAVQADGQVLIGGVFVYVDGAVWSYMARLYNSDASQSLSVPDTTRVQWLRSGAAPEVSLVTFESSTDGGVTWTALGNGTRIPGGWQLTGLSLPSSGYVRARGRATSGYYNGSSGLIEQTGSFTGVVPSVTINAVSKGGKLILSWPSGVLQSATAVRGPYTNVPNAVSPFTNGSITLPQLYYRVKVN